MGFLSSLADATPLVGTIKGLYHYSRGEEEKGDESMYQSTRSSAVIVGGIFGGPAGAMGAGAATDAAASALMKKEKGLIKSCKNIGDDIEAKRNPLRSMASAGIQLGFDAMSGYSGSSGGMGSVTSRAAGKTVQRGGEQIIQKSVRISAAEAGKMMTRKASERAAFNAAERAFLASAHVSFTAAQRAHYEEEERREREWEDWERERKRRERERERERRRRERMEEESRDRIEREWREYQEYGNQRRARAEYERKWREQEERERQWREQEAERQWREDLRIHIQRELRGRECREREQRQEQQAQQQRKEASQRQEQYKKMTQQTSSEQQKGNTDGPTSSSSQPPDDDKNNNNNKKKRKNKNEPSHFENFLKLLKTILKLVYGNESEPFTALFENLPKEQRKSFVKIIKPIIAFGTLDAAIELMIRMFKKHFPKDITFLNIFSLLEFVQAYIADELRERTRISAGTETKETKMTAEERRRIIIEEIVSEEEIIDKIIKLFDGIKTDIEAETSRWEIEFPEFRDMFAAVYHYFKHRRCPHDQRILSVRDYYKWIRTFSNEIKVTQEYALLKYSVISDYVHEVFVPAFRRRFRIVLKHHGDKTVLSSAYVVDGVHKDDKEKHAILVVSEIMTFVFVSITLLFILKHMIFSVPILLLNIPLMFFSWIALILKLVFNTLLFILACVIFILKVVLNIVLIFLFFWFLFFYLPDQR